MAESGYTRPEGSKLKTYFNNIVYGLGIVALGGGIWTAGNGAMSWNSRPLKHDITIRSSSGSYNNADIDFKLFYYWLATLRLKSNPSIVLQQKPEKGLILRPETEFQGLKTLDYVCKQEGILSKDDIVIYYEKDSDGNIALRTRVIPSDLEKAIFPEGEEAISQLLCDYRPSLPPQTMSPTPEQTPPETLPEIIQQTPPETPSPTPTEIPPTTSQETLPEITQQPPSH